jgi:hypothetical protein
MRKELLKKTKTHSHECRVAALIKDIIKRQNKKESDR